MLAKVTVLVRSLGPGRTAAIPGADLHRARVPLLLAVLLAVTLPQPARAGTVTLERTEFCAGGCRYMDIEVLDALVFRADAGEVTR